MRGGLWRAWLARPEAIDCGRGLQDEVDAGKVERAQSFLSGASMLVGKRFVDAVGLMREDYFLYCEEAEWCLRARSKGMRLGYAPRALVLHAHGATTGAAREHRSRPRTPIYLDERNKMLLTQDRFPQRLVVAAPAALALIFLRYAARGAWRQFGYGVSGWWAGLLGERGPPVWITT